MCDLCSLNFTANLSAMAKKGTAGMKTSSCELLLDKWNINHLQTLNIISKKLSVKEYKALTRVLKNYGSTLREVNLVDVKLRGRIALGHCSTLLLALNIESRWMKRYTEVLINSFRHCSNLCSLNMSSTKIFAGVKFLSDGLKHLKNLSLKSNHIASDGATAIGNSLKYCANLQALDLEFNDIGSEGSKALAVSFRYCRKLRALNLASNSIGDDGARALAESLKHCTDLQ